MFQFYIKEIFDVLRMFRLLVSSRYRRVRKMQLYLVLFVLFIYTIFKEDNAPVICIQGPNLRGKPWDSRGKVLDNYFLIVSEVPGKCSGITFGHLPCWEFLLCRVGQRAWLLSSACPHRAGLIPGLWKVKTIIPAHPRRWGSSGYK